MWVIFFIILCIAETFLPVTRRKCKCLRRQNAWHQSAKDNLKLHYQCTVIQCVWRSRVVLIKFLVDTHKQKKFRFDESIKVYGKNTDTYGKAQDSFLQKTISKGSGRQEELEEDPMTIISWSVVNMYYFLYRTFPDTYKECETLLRFQNRIKVLYFYLYPWLTGSVCAQIIMFAI